MFFERKNDKNPPIPNESQRRRDTDDILNETKDILEMSEVQDALERLSIGRMPHLLQHLYVPTVENGVVKADKSPDLIPIVSLHPSEALYVKNKLISLDSLGTAALGVTIQHPQTLVALNQTNTKNPNAPMVAIHELAHVHQLTHNTVNNAAYERYPHFGDAREAEALNVEAVVADVLIGSHDRRWAGKLELLTPLTKHIRSKQPVIPYKETRW